MPVQFSTVENNVTGRRRLAECVGETPWRYYSLVEAVGRLVPVVDSELRLASDLMGSRDDAGVRLQPTCSSTASTWSCSARSSADSRSRCSTSCSMPSRVIRRGQPASPCTLRESAGFLHGPVGTARAERPRTTRSSSPMRCVHGSCEQALVPFPGPAAGSGPLVEGDDHRRSLGEFA